MPRMTTDDIVIRYETLKSERENLDGQLELIERYVMPGRGRFFEEGFNQEESIDWRHREIYDGTAINDAQMLAANVHGNLTSDALEWFKLSFQQEELNENKEAREWLEICSRMEIKGIQESNFGLEAMELYTDAVGFGTGVILHDELPGQPLQWNGHRFASQMMRQCYFEEGFHGEPLSVYIKRSYTPRQLAEKFGRDALPQRVREKIDNPGTGTDKNEDLIRVIYLDIDKKDVDVSQVLSPTARPYVGRYVLTTGREFVGEEQTFYEFPGYILRWQRTAGSKYGHSPAMIALGDILTLQEMVMMIRSATEKTVDPPMKSTRRGIIGNLEMTGGGLTYVRDMDGLAPLLPGQAYRIDTGWDDVNDMRSRIDRMFYVDQLQLKESPTMTATEVRVRYELMQRTLGPTLGRIKDDFLDPVVKNSFWMMYRKGVFPPMPDVVQAMKGELKIEYLGPLARSQRLTEVDGIQRWLGMTGELSQIPGAQELTDIPDYDEALKYIGTILGVPEKLIRSDVEVKKLRDDRKKKMEQAEGAAMGGQVASAAKDMAQAQAISPGMGGGNGQEAPPGAATEGG